MKLGANWYVRAGVILVALAIVAAALGCGGNNGTLSLNPAGNGAGANTSSASKTTGVLIVEDQIGSLPAWQQELLSDPGWNQPYIEPDPGTPIEPPTDAMLEESTQRALETGLVMVPRANTSQEAGKSVSWTDQGIFDPSMKVGRGEYETYTGVGTPPFGCNANHSNDLNTISKGVEDVIRAYPYVNGLQRISYVLRGTASNNHFVKGAVQGNNAASAVYQLYSSNENAVPTAFVDEVEEISYRADQAIDPGTSQPAAPGGACPGARAYLVTGAFWIAFNSEFSALPNGGRTALYNVFIAPQSDQIGPETSGTPTDASYQMFYLGNQAGMYKDAWIVGIESTDGGCRNWKDLVANHASTGFFHIPIYGVLLARWQDAVLPGDAGPWESIFGWPVHGPQPLKPGATMTARGQYFAWGMWFERGFIWWIDYDQERNPATPDEAQAYLYTGTNVYCKDGVYESLEPKLYYGGNGPLAVSVSVDAMRYVGTDPWAPVPFNTSLRRYEIPLEDAGFDTVTLAMHAQAYGGTANGDGVYKNYVWAFRDGYVTTPGGDYLDTNRYLTHTYGRTTQNYEGTYVVRVQVTDSVDARAYGDSFPIVLGHTPSTGGSVVLLRNDDGLYGTNYDALADDLDELAAAGVGFGYTKADYSDAIDLTSNSLVIWYRGGPAGVATGSIDERQITAAQAAKLTSTIAAGVPVLMFFQNAGISATCTWYANSSSNYELRYPIRQPSIPTGYTPQDWCNAVGWPYNSWSTSNICPVSGLRGVMGNGNLNYVNGSTTFGERYTGEHSSYMMPTAFLISGALTSTDWQCSVYRLNTSYTYPAGHHHGFGFAGDPCIMSWGNSTAGKLNWTVTYPWSNVTVTNSNPAGMERWHLLQNIIAGLAPAAFAGSGGPVFIEYDGNPEIISVTPSYISDTGDWVSGLPCITFADQPTYPGGGYPDQTSTNVYRTTDPGAGNYVITGNPNNDWINGNDVDFQFPWYAFVYDPDDSLAIAPYTVSNDEVLVGYGGLVVEDDPVTPIWTRDGRVPWGDQDFIDVAGWTEDQLRPVAGYYRTNVDVVGAPASDTAVKANYGTEAVSLTSWSNDRPLMAEAIAHWVDDDVLVPTLQWAMFPGHSMIIDGDQFPHPLSFIYDSFLTGFDIDPMESPIDRAAGPYNRSIFTGLETENNGRYVEWDFQRSSANWYGDLNRDGAITLADKFPVRCRLYLDNGMAAPGNWPDHMYNPGSAPSGGVQPTDGDYIEGGCYVIDNGDMVQFLTLSDDPTVADPAESTTYLSGTSPAEYEVDLSYTVSNVIITPVTIELDANYNGVTFGSDPAQVYTVRTGIMGDGTYGDTVTITNDVIGNYNFALRASDGAQTSVLWYPDQVFLLPATFDGYLIVEDNVATGVATPSADAVEADLNSLGATIVDRVLASNLPGTAVDILSTFIDYECVIWCSRNSSTGSGQASPLDADEAEAALLFAEYGGTWITLISNPGRGSGTQASFAQHLLGYTSSYAGCSESDYGMQVTGHPPASGTGGTFTDVATADQAEMSQSNKDASAIVWGHQPGFSSYCTILYNPHGLGQGLWVSTRWDNLTASPRMGFLFNLLEDMDAYQGTTLTDGLAMPTVSTILLYHENFENTPSALDDPVRGDSTPNTAGVFPNGGWTLVGAVGSISGTPWDWHLFNNGTHPYFTTLNGYNGTSRFLAFETSAAGEYGYEDYRHACSPEITVIPGATYRLVYAIAGGTESGYDFIVPALAETIVAPTGYGDFSGLDSYFSLSGNPGAVWSTSTDIGYDVNWTAGPSQTTMHVIFGFHSDVFDDYGGPVIDEVMLYETSIAP